MKVLVVACLHQDESLFSFTTLGLETIEASTTVTEQKQDTSTQSEF
jgi:hypothetical protein